MGKGFDMTLLSIDPGIRGSGAALFIDSRLIRAEYVRNPAKEGSGPRECATMAQALYDWACSFVGRFDNRSTLAQEIPATYSGRATRGDANDLFPLMGVQAALAALLPSAEVLYYRPSEWKGSIQKPLNASGEVEYVITTRVKSRLSAEEQACVKWPSSVKYGWDVADSLGVGLAALGRFDRMRRFARE